MVHRLAILYLVLPVMIWLVGWFHWWLGIPAALLIATALGKTILPSWKVSSWQFSFNPVTGVLLLIAFAWVMATAAGGVFDIDNTDAHKHRALLLHLSRDDWPVYIATYLESPLLLRYYLGYYMAPGLMGKWLGMAALNWAVPLWSWCGAALALLLFTRGLRGWTALVAAPMLIFFGITVGLTPIWKIDYDYSVFKLFAYAPQHVIPAVLYALLLIQLRRHPQFLPISWSSHSYKPLLVNSHCHCTAAAGGGADTAQRCPPIAALAELFGGSPTGSAVHSVFAQRD